jgi:YD repeat-containing protein
MWKKVWLISIISLLLFIATAPALAQAGDGSFGACDNVTYLMERNITPYDMSLSGGTLRSNSTENGTLGAGAYADFWSFSLTRPRNQNNILQDLPTTIRFTNVSGAGLEFALFNGIIAEIDYQPLLEGEIPYSPSAETAAYTIVVRKINLADESAGNYAITVVSDGMGDPILSVRDETTNRDIAPAPALSNGVARITAPAAEVFIHPDGTRRVHPRGGASTQVFMPSEQFDYSAFTINVGNWANKLSFLGGDFAAVGTDRVYFLENFDFRLNSATELDLKSVTYGDGTSIRTDWLSVAGMWVMNDCTGFKLTDGRTFTATTPATAREIRAEGALNAFLLTVNAITPTGSNRHNAILNLTSIRENSQITLRDGVYHLDLVTDRQLNLQSVNMTLTSPDSTGDIVPMVINFDDQSASIRLDWVNMRLFSLLNNTITFEFLDAPRGTTTRDGTNISIIQARDDVIQLIYKETGGLSGEQRLMLPASDSYLEIVTPAGLPTFDGKARAGQVGYFPRALNNTGGDCYPTNTAVPEANCPPTGHINPANGNLWLSMTDAVAFGDMLNLDVTRHYNSAYATMDSPFGKGWTSAFLLDYAVTFDQATNSRTVTPQTVAGYAIGLDVTFAPRGIITFTTPTGSRHQFVGDPAFVAGDMTSLTMPGWVVSRESVWSNWFLMQDNGQLYEFDRAGRLIRYGYPRNGRTINIAYPRANLNGAADIGAETPVIITDHTGDFAPRQLELYYNEAHHIVKTILRDMTIGADATTCTLADNCVQTDYVYENGLLTQVTYADGQFAAYVYDELGRLTGVSDPRAPITPNFGMSYDEFGEALGIVITNADDTALTYQQLSVSSTTTSRVATIIDRLGNSTSHTYTLATGDLRTIGTSYQLTQSTSPLAGTGDRLEDTPTVYRWGSDQNPLLAGFLTRIESRVSTANQGRASRDYNYTPNGQLQCVACAFQSLPRLEVTYDRPLELRSTVFRPTSVSYADGTTERFEYDPSNNGLLTRYIDRDGADYSFTWTESVPFQVTRMTRANDGVMWEYFYNPVGLVVSMVQTVPNDTLPYQVSYQWDGLGRLIAVNDGVLGRYTIEYPAPTTTDDGAVVTEIIMTDPVGASTISVFNGLGQLIETRVEQLGVIIRKTTRSYDPLGREIATTEWLGDIGSEDELLPLTTSTTYTPLASYLLVDSTEAIVRGEQVTVSDPYGRETITIYDALGQIRRTIDATGLINDYTYNANNVDNATVQFGLQITQRTALLGTPLTNRVDYFFDIRRQLRAVRTGVRNSNDTQPILQEWTINGFGDTARQRSLTNSVDGRTLALREVTWGEYVSGQPPSVSLSQVPLPLNTPFNVETDHRASLGVNYDFLGRQTQIASANSNTQVIYCPLPTGGMQVAYGTAPSCEGDGTLALSYDVHGRLIEAIDANGRRTMTYTPNLDSGAWDVVVAFSSNMNDATWVLSFNPLGAISTWTDENGILHDYNYDTRGRLRSLVMDVPEADQYFTYNNADKLIEQADGLGRGYLYNYDPFGRVVSKVDLRTADAISYSYTPTGLLSAVTASDGSTTIYVYEDRTNPNRLTRIIEPTGAQHQFIWSDSNTDVPRLNNTLIYIDPFNNRTEYRYDGTGLLWRIDDPLPISATARRTSELQYNDDGDLTTWLRAIDPTNQRPASQLTINTPAPSVWQVSDSTPNGTGWATELLFGAGNVLAGAGNTRFGYDALGRLTNASAGDDLFWSLGWSSGMLSFTDPIAGNTVMLYDALHRLVTEGEGDGLLRYEYAVGDGDTAVMTINHPTYGARQIVFSPGNARTGESPTVFIRAYGQETAYVYDGEGRLTEITTRVCSDASYENVFDCITDDVPLYETHALITYNSVGLPIRIADEDGNLETFAYDDAKRLIAYQNANGRNFTYSYDEAGRLSSLATATGVKLILRYNLLDALTGICRTRASEPNNYDTCVTAGGELESYTYDTLGRLASRTFGASSTDYRYDDTGNLISAGDVTYAYVPNVGLLAEMAIPNGGTYAFTYADLNTLASAGDVTFTYNDVGELIGQNDRTSNLTMGYDLATQTYSIGDSNNRLGYTLDPRGYLSQILFNDNPLMDIDYLSLQSAVDVLWNDDTLIAYTLNNARQTSNLLFSGANEMSVYYDVSGTGETLRQNIILPFANGGYVVIYGYDNDERPLTMRVTDFQGLAVLFSQSITYNELGLRTGETWQYGDGTQVITRYGYEGNRLSERRVGVVGNTSASFVYAYDYDDAGNITAITETTTAIECATMRYDGMNRLISITKNEDQTEFLYDAYGRLTRAGDVRLTYRADSDDVLVVTVGNQPYYMGGVNNQPPLFQVGRGGDVTWLINDGRNRTLQPYISDSDPSNEVWLFDALGRYVAVGTPNFADVCNLNGLPSNITPQLAVQPLADGAIWVANSGLYVQDGRAYDIETGLFTSRSANIDALGNVYESQNNATFPYPVTAESANARGLNLLREAVNTATLNTSLTANAVLNNAIPQVLSDISPLAQARELAGSQLATTTEKMLLFPNWLETSYNLPSAYRDEDGYLRVPLMDTPAQAGLGGFVPPFSTDIPAWDNLLMTSIDAPQQILNRLVENARPSAMNPFSTYRAQSDIVPLLAQTWREPISAPVTPSDVMAWLPSTLDAPHIGAYALDLADMLEGLPEPTAADWVNERLNAHLPQLPNTPPISLDEWREEIFRDDLLDPLAEADVLPNLPDMPFYRWGANADWLHVGR